MTADKTEEKNYSEYWTYHPDYIENSIEIFKTLLPQLQKLGNVTTIQIYGKKVNIPRQTCAMVFKDINDEQIHQVVYKGTRCYRGNSIPKEILILKHKLEQELKLDFDYVLCHIYRNGYDHIGYHQDNEALNSDIVSLTLSEKEVSRKFRFRPVEWKTSYIAELNLKTGDMVRMYGPNEKNNMIGCQKKYKHSIIKIGGKRGEKIGPRINLTFRFYEKKI